MSSLQQARDMAGTLPAVIVDVCCLEIDTGCCVTLAERENELQAFIHDCTSFHFTASEHRSRR